MLDKEIAIDHWSLFRLFLFAIIAYMMLWAVRYAGWYLFGYWGSMSIGDPMTMLLMFWGPLLLFLIILITLIMALSAEGGRKAPYPSIFVYAAIFLGLTLYFIWFITSFLIMGFS